MQSTPSQQKKLLKLARDAISAHFRNVQLPKHNFKERGCCFVTLHKNSELRGCIGSFEPKFLGNAIIENAISAATKDFRFEPLSAEELEQIEIEISVLSEPKPLKYENSDELLKILDAKKPGIIISLAAHQATFLPQVWEQLPKPEEFLSHLCIKAGLRADAWIKIPLEVQTYEASVFREVA